MKRLHKLLCVFCLLTLSLMLFSLSAQADTTKPGRVKNLTAKAGESKIAFSWKKVSGADGYYFYLVNDDGEYVKLIDLDPSKNAITLKRIKGTPLENGKYYTFAVSAYRKADGKILEGKASATVTARPRIKKPGTPSLSVASVGSKKVKLSWNKISGATGYQILQKNSAGKYVALKTVLKPTTVKVTIKKLKNGKTYSFKIRALRKVNGKTRYGSASAAVSARPFYITKAMKGVHTAQFKATIVATVKGTRKDNGKAITLNAGTHVTCLWKSYTHATVELSNGVQVDLEPGYVHLDSFILESGKGQDYSKKTKEGFVNYKGYSSPTPYLIWVSVFKQTFNLFKGSQGNWKMVNYSSSSNGWRCSTGMIDCRTMPGTYSIRRKATWFEFEKGGYAYWASFFSGNAIHSWLYHHPAGGEALFPDQQLQGVPQSHGCVRIDTGNARWVYDNVPTGTTVIVY